MKSTVQSQHTIKAGTRSSKLALLQTQFAITKLTGYFPNLNFSTVRVETPGDLDRTTDLRNSSANFFTETLDNAVIQNDIDCAIHSAKDLPKELPEELDYFYLPWKEDRRDVLVYRIDSDVSSINKPKIGVSSNRREQYFLGKFPNGELLGIRGNIEDRIKQLDDGKYDIIITAAAALHRLGLQNRINKYIPLNELNTPDAQGALALTFKKGNPLFNKMRKLFIYPVSLAGAGIGSIKNITVNTLEEIKSCDVCLHDALCPENIRELAQPNSEWIYVGKRKDKHSLSQDQICRLISDYQKQGKRVLRLKGGDLTIFSRISEEIHHLNQYDLPYRTFPGITSLSLGALNAGIVPTKRNISRGFTVFTPYQAGDKSPTIPSGSEHRQFTKVIFMGISAIKKLSAYFINEEQYPRTTPVTVVFNAGMTDQEIIHSDLSRISNQLSTESSSKAGLIFIGNTCGEKNSFKNSYIFSNEKVLFAGSRKLACKAEKLLSRYCSSFQTLQLIETYPNAAAKELANTLKSFEWLIFSSPTAVEIFFNLFKEAKIDIRSLPKIISGGSETEKELNKYGVYSDLKVSDNYGSFGLVETIKNMLPDKSRILRLCSDKSSDYVVRELSERGYDVLKFVLYKTSSVKLDKCPPFSHILFTSPSSIDSFIQNFGKEILENKTICVIGDYTNQAFKEYNIKSQLLMPKTATVADMIFEMAVNQTRKSILDRK